ncbi:MucR family transcriptional regulator [Methylobacterium sp. C25]|uniref:MucR family transcriptional regulator n=1 Tax=Methylobacterium sp. C25 TaxID=2721622 RepID=UPI001F228154|nr:MucR family transcriptional regulator [Methylobacterium sp. C25]MCE4224831.1 MucR family transcriptional regulator [Methylobacterium sp. C25]
MSESSDETARRVTLTADIVSAYVSNNHVQSADLAKLLSDVHTAICGVTALAPAAEAAPARATAQEIRRSISHEHLISFEDGKPYKTLRRHLTLRGLSPEQYRAKWGLSPDYPMTSASYSEQRSELARALGLGQQRRKTVAVVASDPVLQSVPVEAGPPKKARASRKKDG